jgi:hypothetical protein
MLVEDCIRCGEAPGIDDQGYCGHCHGTVKVEIREGLHQLRDYLAAWARFSDWSAHDDRPWL